MLYPRVNLPQLRAELDAADDRDRWWSERGLARFLGALRTSFRAGEREHLEDWREWLTRGDGQWESFGRSQPEWARCWMVTFLEFALSDALRGQWTAALSGVPAEPHDGLSEPDPAPDSLSGARAAFPTAFWRDVWAVLMRSDELASLLSAPPAAAVPDRRIVRFPLDLPIKDTAIICRFELEAVGRGNGEIFLAPDQVLTRQMRGDFAAVFRDAEVATRQLLGEVDRSDVRLRIHPDDPAYERVIDDLLLVGSSAGGALALGVWALWSGHAVDSSLACSFRLVPEGPAQPDGRAHAVGALRPKAEACRKESRVRGLLTAALESDEGRRELETLRRWADGNPMIQPVRTLQDATRYVQGLPRAFECYYQQLIEGLDATGWEDHRGEPVRVRSVKVPIHVLKEERSIRGPDRLDAGFGGRPQTGPSAGERSDRDRTRQYVDPEVARLYEQGVEERRERVPWSRERRSIRRALILGGPGGGKSFLTQLTAIELAEEGLAKLGQGDPIEQLPIPIHVSLPVATQDHRSLEDAALARVREILAGKIEADVTEELCGYLSGPDHVGQHWLVLDALDQVKQDRLEVTRGWLREPWPTSGTAQPRLIVTCRRGNYEGGLKEYLPVGKVTEYELALFQPSQVRTFVDGWFRGEPERAQALKGVLSRSYSVSHACTVPIIATLACLVHGEKAIDETAQSKHLYEEGLRILIRRGARRRPEPAAGVRRGARKRPGPTDLSNLEVSRYLWVLDTVALGLMLDDPRTNHFASRDLHDRFADAVARRRLKLTPEDVIDDLVRGGLLVDGGPGADGDSVLSFLHRTFEEYLAARNLADQVNRNGWSAPLSL